MKLLGRLLQALWRELLLTADQVAPGWSQPRPAKSNQFGAPLSPEAVRFWTEGERYRRNQS